MEHSSDAFWSTYARSYDRVLPVMPFYRDAIQRHIAAILACGARRVLDVGCGTGNVAIPLAIAGARVIALDKSDAMLERLRDKAIAHSVEGEVEIVVNNAEEAQFPTPVDAVNCLLALFCMTDGVAVLGKMIKSLRPGGIVVLTEPTRRFSEELLLEYGREVLFDRMQRVDLADDWDVVRNAGKALGGGCIPVFLRLFPRFRGLCVSGVRGFRFDAHLSGLPFPVEGTIGAV